MGETQKHPIGNQFNSAIMQENLTDLFDLAHQHRLDDELPASTDGTARDIKIVDDGMNVYLVVKTTRGWFRTSALTAI